MSQETPGSDDTSAHSSAPSAEPKLDFKAIAEHLILWPTTVAVKTPTTVAVMADGKKVQDLALEAGGSVLRTLTTTYGNVKGIAVRV